MWRTTLVTTEIRPFRVSEAVDYLRVLPFANGLPSWEPAPAAWHGGEGAWPPPSPPASRETLEAWGRELLQDDSFRPQAAFVDGKLVGGSAMLSLELTVPGYRQVAMGGITSTGVIATHRRRGLLRHLMHAMFADARERGEFVAGLSASEGSIYGRFGFSPATLRTRWELDRSAAAFAEDTTPSGTVELVDAAGARLVWPAVHDVARRQRVGEVSAQKDRWADLSDAATGTDGPLRYLVHRSVGGEVDGIANYRLPWSSDMTVIGTLVVEALEATTTDAYSALWRLLADFDLTRRIVAAPRPVDEPLRWMLKNPRAMRITRQSDNLWLRLLDVAPAAEARAYGVDDRLVLAVTADEMCPRNTGVWRLDASVNEATCVKDATAEPEISLDIQALSSLYLGGASPSILMAAGRIAQHREGGIAKTARLFCTDPPPFNAIGF